MLNVFQIPNSKNKQETYNYLTNSVWSDLEN